MIQTNSALFVQKIETRDIACKCIDAFVNKFLKYGDQILVDHQCEPQVF